MPTMAAHYRRHDELIVERQKSSHSLESTYSVSSPKPQHALLTTRMQETKRSVHFNEDVFVRETIHVNDIYDHEMDQYWYSKREFMQIKKDYVFTMKTILYQEVEVDSEEYCMRGLEMRTKEGCLRRQINKMRARMAVLEEQQRQLEIGMADDLLLSLIYIKASDHCRKDARSMGQQDEEAAKLAYKSKSKRRSRKSPRKSGSITSPKTDRPSHR